MNLYMLHPGEVVSHNDGQTHFISAPVLARLYGIHSSQWVSCPGCSGRPGRCERALDRWTHLFPRSDGNYRL